MQIPQKNETFIHISHTYVPGTETKLDSLVQKIPLSKYDLILLGGDLCGRTSMDMSTMQYVDSIFDVSNPKTIWAVGNHDYDNVDNLVAVTNKPLYYAAYHNGITFLVLDTQDSMTNFVGEQLQLIKNVTDTIAESAHLVVLTHKVVWMMDNGVMQPIIDSVSNGPLGTCFWCLNPNNFYSDVYPLLLNVRNRGVNVVCLGGDLGKFDQAFSYANEDNILFLGSGMCSGCAVNYCIVFDYDPESRKLTYSFKLLTDLATN